MHDLLFEYQEALEDEDPTRYAADLELDSRRVMAEVRAGEHARAKISTAKHAVASTVPPPDQCRRVRAGDGLQQDNPYNHRGAPVHVRSRTMHVRRGAVRDKRPSRSCNRHKEFCNAAWKCVPIPLTAAGVSSPAAVV